jgi:LuxR family transcriptional regulator, positive regulator of biofilm formation
MVVTDEASDGHYLWVVRNEYNVMVLNIFMQSKKRSKKTGPGSTPKAFLNIVGRNMMQNELLLSFLEQETGLKGASFPRLESIIPIVTNKSSIPQVFIFDRKNIDMKYLWTNIHEWNCSHGFPCFFVLGNAIADSAFEKKAMDSGIQGIFYDNDPLPLIAKGICAVLQGDLWYSRKAMARCLMEKKSLADSSTHPAIYGLTFREKKILACIASGYSNKAIADEFCISLHTIKTHISNIYKKINVNNRSQASLWATKSLLFS